jgi:hypothetical protein
MIKKIVLLATIVGAMSITGNAQELGVRFGNFGGNNVAIDGVFSLGDFSRIHADVSFGGGVGIDALYDFINQPIGGAEGLNWYLGVGASVFIGDNYFGLGVPGEIGLEYRFEGAPIALGIDWRPTFILIENTDFYADSFGFNARYVFGN